MILIKINNITGDSLIEGFDGYFTVDSFSFGSERELKDSAKAGTSDINIGMAELQECSCGKSMDITSPYLARKAISGSSCGACPIF